MSQQVILKHGASAPSSAKTYNKGEVLVRHAADAKDAALYTVLNDGKTLESFPSKTYVDTQLSAINENLSDISSKHTTIKEGTDLDGVYVTGTTVNGARQYEIKGVNLARKSDLPSITLNTVTGDTAGVNVSVDATGKVYTISGVNLASKIEVTAAQETASDALELIQTLISGTTEERLIDNLNQLFEWADEHAGEIESSQIFVKVPELEKTLTGFTPTNTVKKTTDNLASLIAANTTAIGNIDQDFVKKIKVYKSAGTTEEIGGPTADLTSMIIDCGEY